MASELNFSWLDDFQALAASGNFSRAAEERHMTQPAFSRRIRALEEWLGAELFDRGSQPVRLTATGEWFGAVARDLQAAVARVPGEARTIAEAANATLRIAATHALSFTFLPAWLRSLESRIAVGPIQLVSDVQARCEALLALRQVQFVVSHANARAESPLAGDEFRSCVVGRDRLLPVSAPRPSHGPLHALEGSGEVEILAYGPDSGLRRILDATLGPALAARPHRTRFTAHMASVLRTMALDGRGLAWLPEVLVRDDLAQARLVAAGDERWSVAVEIRLFRSAGRLNEAGEAFWSAASAGPPTKRAARPKGVM